MCLCVTRKKIHWSDWDPITILALPLINFVTSGNNLIPLYPSFLIRNGGNIVVVMVRKLIHVKYLKLNARCTKLVRW